MPENIRNLESYPPAFRQLNNATANASPLEHVFQACSDDPIPSIDLQCLSQDKLGKACKEWGIFRLINHGVPPKLLSKLQDHCEKLFTLPFESKQALLSTSPMSYFWGTPFLTPSGNTIKGALSMNWLEGLNILLSQLPESHSQSQHPMLECIRLLLEEYGNHLARIATTLFDAMVKDLNLDPKQSKSNLAVSTGFLRLYRYPYGPMTDEAFGMVEHTDSSVLSIVNQDQVGGLEIFKDNKWLSANPIPNTLLVNVGDMMQAISDDKYMSVKHRVRVKKQEERFSVCYFIFPAEGAVIHSSKYKPFTYAEFQEQVQNDTKTLGYKVGLQRFKLVEDA